MTGQLRYQDEDSFIRCYLCGQDAAGPCATCRRSVCGDCCVLVEGAAKQWAVCIRCERPSDGKLSGWSGLALFFGKIVLGLLVAIVFLAWLSSR